MISIWIRLFAMATPSLSRSFRNRPTHHQLRHTVGCLLIAIFGWLTPTGTAAGLDGIWKLELQKPGGVTLKTFFVLQQNGTNLAGKVIINDAVDLPLRDARAEGSNFVFNVDWGFEYSVRLVGDELCVTQTHRGKSKQVLTAQRVPESEALPPKVLPLPAVRDLDENGLATRPPMGWNSWNHFGEAVDDKVIRETADAMATSGMAAAGYEYVNIDDTWEGGRDTNGNIFPNQKFPDMKALADYVHSRGLKLGIYSSPGARTCGGYEGSYGHEEQDARTFAGWEIDYLKYDWCSAARVYQAADLRAGYQKMGTALAHSGRPIVYSLCEYGMGEVWTWGGKVGANLWRTTDDIRDNWKSMSEIGFAQKQLAPYAGPGHWNDPDMLEIGNGGMSHTEYRTHFSLWCLLAAPLMAGNDLRHMSPETCALLTNREVIAVDQDILGKQGERILKRGDIEIWEKPLQNGSRAIGIFNRSEDTRDTAVSWTELGLDAKPKMVRDLWEHQALVPETEGWRGRVPAHGTILLFIK